MTLLSLAIIISQAKIWCLIDKCYWKIYPSEMTRIHPCDPNKTANGKGNHASEFEGRNPFKFTISTINFAAGQTVSILVAVDSVDGEFPTKYDLDCDGDGVYEHIGLTKAKVCRFASKSGNHQIRLRGEIPSLQLCKNPTITDNTNSVISVDSWGDLQWQSLSRFAADCVNLKTLPDNAPDLNKVTDMSSMFAKASAFNQPLENWDVSHVTNMNELFRDASMFDQPLENWDVSNVRNMNGIFRGASRFNQPLEKWNVSNVTDVAAMFLHANSFNQPLENWDVSNVTDMGAMFADAVIFQPATRKMECFQR